MTVLVYVNTSRQVGDAEHIKVFANQDAAEKWFEDNDPEGVAFEYGSGIKMAPAGRAEAIQSIPISNCQTG